MEQSQFRVDSPSISNYRTNVDNENPFPVSAPVSPALERLTLNLRLRQWENKAYADLSSLSSGRSLREDSLTPQITTAKGA
jgi:hypothetical protein